MPRTILLVLLLTVALPAQVSAQETPTCLGHDATVVGTEGDDVIYATDDDASGDAHPVVVALGGDDIIVGNNHRDIICAGDGNDEIHDSRGENRVAPGPGDDAIYVTSFTRIHYNPSESAVTVDLREMTATGEGTDTFIGDGPRAVFGSSFDDTLIAGNGVYILGGHLGNDQLIGSSSDETLKGGPGNDSIEAGEGNDFVKASSGDDYVDGQEGKDRLDGGSGTDTCANGEENLNCEA